MVSGAIQIICMLSAVWVDRRFKQTIAAMMAAVVPTIIGTIVLMVVPFEKQKRVGLLFAYYIMISFWACAGLALSLVTRNVAGQTKKSVVIALNFVCWATGNAIGPQTFRSKDAPRYFLALAIVLGCFILLEINLFCMRCYYVWQNKRRDAKIENGEGKLILLFVSLFLHSKPPYKIVLG
jgi:MFS family permease